MKISAENVLRGKVTAIRESGLHAELAIEVAPGLSIASTVPLASVKQLELRRGAEVYAVFASADVHVGIPHHKRGED